MPESHAAGNRRDRALPIIRRAVRFGVLSHDYGTPARLIEIIAPAPARY
jgi:hypothetical protein